MSSSLPQGWYHARLAQIGDWTSGGTPSRERADFYGEGIPWVKTGDLCDGPLLEVPESITSLGLANSSAKRLPVGTLLVAMYGATIGKLGLLTFEAATNQACAALLPSEKTPEFIPYVFQFLLSQRDELRRIGQGGAQPNISQAILKDYRIPLAPLSEQRRIVAKLEALQARSRRAREALDSVPPLLEKLRQSILAAAFRGDLTKDWRAQNSNTEPASALLARIRAERRKKWEESELAKLKAKGKPPTDDRWKAKYQEPVPADVAVLSEQPEGWVTVQLGEVVSRLTNGYVGPTRGIYVDAGIPYLLSKHVKKGVLKFDGATFITQEFNEKNRKSILQKGDVLLVQTGHVGESAVVPAEHAGHNCHAMIVISPIESVLDGRYLSHLFTAPRTQRAFEAIEKGMTLRHLNCHDVILLQIQVPPLAEQIAIVERLEPRLESIARLHKNLKKLSDELDGLDQSLLSKAFSGELVPQDPNDEPADVMLARLRSDGTPDSSRARPRTRAAE